jgi:hypothetical protein
MGIRQLYLLAGVLWALLLAPVAVVMSVGVAAGLAWLFIFGDNPWPRWAELFLLVVGVTAAAVAVVASIVIANSAGKAQAASLGTHSASARRRAIGLAIAPVVIALFAASALWQGARQREQAVSDAAAREAGFAQFIASNKKLTDLDIESDSQGAFRALARVSGNRDGAYELKWRIIPSSAKQAIFEGRRPLRLTTTTEPLEILFSTDDLKSRYQAIVLHGRGGALIDEQFRLEVSLNPIVTSEERQNFPPGEGRRLNAPESPLESRRTTEFSVRFTIPQ